MLRSQLSRRGLRAVLALSGLVAPAALVGTTLPARANDVTPPVIPATLSTAAASANLHQQIAGRIQEITLLASRVAASRSLSSADRAALNSTLSGDLAGLTSLQASSELDTSIAQIRADATTMVLAYHVYSFVEPVVQVVLRLDSSRAAAARIDAVIPSIKTTIVASAASSGRIAQANSLLATLPVFVSTIENSTSGVVGTLLALSSSSVPGSLPLLSAATTTASAAAHDVHVAYMTIGRIVSLVTANSRMHRR